MSSSREEGVVTLNLRDAYKAAKWRRAEAAVALLRERVKRVTHAERVVISGGVSRYLWSRGAERPPKKVRIVVERGEEGEASVRLEGEEAAGE